MCGEHWLRTKASSLSTGSSPHVRGALWVCHAKLLTLGIIPACAGSTIWVWRCCAVCRDHPRMCGEHVGRHQRRPGCAGSSPHVRGALDAARDRRLEQGIIPACAGSTRRPSALPWRRWDHPRMCGEHRLEIHHHVQSLGSSPHVRGAHGIQILGSDLRGIIPACAGSTDVWWCRSADGGDHPRMCGEHRLRLAVRIVEWGSSPHVRGALGQSGETVHRRGIIPACAGSTDRYNAYKTAIGDHPRMCGEHA